MNLLPFETMKREVLVRDETPSDPAYGISPENRSMDELMHYGIINVNKPKGPTSFKASSTVGKILGVKKTGHSGTLDSNVTGVLPVALGRATRIMAVLLNAGKEYVGTMHVHDDVDESTVRGTVFSFIGRIKQLPPVRSAVKRVERYRYIYYIDIMTINGRNVLFKVGCEAGTYIRKLCHDIGEKLGTGAHMTELRRTKAGPFKEDNMVSLEDIANALKCYQEDNDASLLRKIIQPVENAVIHLAKVWVMDRAVNPLCYGTGLAVQGISRTHAGIEPEETVAVMTLKDELVGLGKACISSESVGKQNEGVAVKMSKVFMKPGTYPVIGE